MRRIINVRLPQTSQNFSLNNIWWVGLDKQNLIVELQPMGNEEDQLDTDEDWKQDFLSPMGIDLQINGGLGLTFNQLSYQDLPKLLKLLDQLWLDGVEGICPTLITCKINQLRDSLNVLREARQSHRSNRCQLLGAHLEGPFIDKSHLGVHPEKDIELPSLEGLEKRIQGFEKEIAMMTLAPELPGAKAVIKELNQKQIISCLGHSNAKRTDCDLAFKDGVTMLTHAFNAMNGLHHREPGPVGAAISNGNIGLGLIADGKHISPLIASILNKLAPQNLILVSDALFPYGLKDGKYLWGNRELTVKKGTCKITNGRLAGTTLPLLDGCKNLAKWIQDPAAAIWAATIAPREILWGKASINKYLLGQPLSRLIRWTDQPGNESIHWRQAA